MMYVRGPALPVRILEGFPEEVTCELLLNDKLEFSR